jgi:hypothetical protein
MYYVCNLIYENSLCFTKARGPRDQLDFWTKAQADLQQVLDNSRKSKLMALLDLITTLYLYLPSKLLVIQFGDCRDMTI